jgi:hypothetical protein
MVRVQLGKEQSMAEMQAKQRQQPDISMRHTMRDI